MTDLRQQWEGVRLSGDYILEKWSGGDERAAFFQTSAAPDGRRAVVKVVREATGDGAATLDLWRRTHQLRHPNLIELLDCGRAEHNGEAVLYAAFESPDETLAAAMERAPLGPEESREVLDAVLDALRYLHAQGLVAGAVDADHVVAAGERVKLSTGAVREAESPSAYREDVRLLGELWLAALLPASPKSVEIAAHAADADPRTRWTLAEIGAALGPALPAAPPPQPPEAVESAIAAGLSTGEPPAPDVPAPAAIPVEAATPPPFRELTPEPAATRRHFANWVFAGAAVAVLLILALNWPRLSGVGAHSGDASVPQPAETPVSAAPAPIPKAPAPTAAAEPAPAASPANWRVIAFTYRTRAAAAKKAEALNNLHPGLNATVFSPRNRSSYYLVALGGRMTREDAVRLQRSARRKGLPRDLYVQNYSE